MPQDSHRATWASYQAAWEDCSSTERGDLLAKSVTEDCLYTDPQGKAHGLSELFTYIEKFREAMPGVSFTNHTFLDHHAQSMATWTLYDSKGAELQPGSSWASYGDDGRITRVSGFFELPAGS